MMECPNCGGENVWLYKRVDVHQSVVDFTDTKVLVNREHEIVSNDATSEIDNEIQCADCDEVISCINRTGARREIELFPPDDLRTAHIDGAQCIRKLVADREREEARALAIVQEIHSVLKTKFHSKKITKRLATVIQKAHPDWSVHYSNAYGTIRLSIWGGDSGFESHSKRMDILVAYEQDVESYDSAVFPERAVCYYAGGDRNTARRAFLDSNDPEKLAIGFARLKAAKDVVKKLLNDTIDSGGISEVFGENNSQFY